LHIAVYTQVMPLHAIISMQSNGAAITLSSSSSGRICWWFRPDFNNL